MKRNLMSKFGIGLLCALFALPVMGQEDELKNLDGYVDFGDLSASYGEPKITINLGGTMLNFVGMMSSSESPETSDLISKLKGIRVQIYSLGENLDAARNQFSDTKSQLKSSGWEPIVQINEDDEQVLVYMKAVDGNMEGMTVMVVDDEEAVSRPMASARACRCSERSRGVSPDQAGNASRAARTARSTSAPVPSGTRVRVEPRAGSTTSRVGPSPSMTAPLTWCPMAGSSTVNGVSARSTVTSEDAMGRSPR